MVSPAEIAETLTATLNPDPNIRIGAELKLASHLSHPEAGLALSQLLLAQDVDMPLRQISARVLRRHSASLALKKYVNERWSPYFPAFKGDAPSVDVKNQIRQAIFQGLSDPSRKIRSLSAVSLSLIASCDWPDEYPDLLTALINLLSSGSPDSVHGSMQVFAEFIKSDLTEDQILPMLRQLLPVLLDILGSTEKHSALTRSRTVSVFQQCVMALFMVKDQHGAAVKEATASVLPVWLEAFRVLLNIDPASDVSSSDNWDGLTIRVQIYKALNTIHTCFPRSLTTYLPDFLSSSVAHLHQLYPTFERCYLDATDAVPGTSEDGSIELAQLTCPLLDFVGAVARGGKARDWFNEANLSVLVSAVLNHVQITNEDEETWESNANAFVAQEDDETQAYSIRVAGFDLMSSLIDCTPARVAAICQNLIQQVVESSRQAREAGKPDWWRLLEAVLAMIGSQSEALLDCVDDEEDAGRPKPIDIEFLLVNVIPSVLQLSQYPFLQGRAFVFASQFAKLLPLQLAGQYLEAAVQVIEASEPGVPVKVSAVKAIHNFCQGGEDSAIEPFVLRIAKDLGPFLLITSEDTLSLVLESLSVVLEVSNGAWMTPELANNLVLAILEVWAKNNKDPIFLSIFTDILSTLSSSPAQDVYPTVVKQALPTLCHSIASAKQNESWIASSALEMVSSLVEGSPESGLGEGFFAVLAPSLFHCLGDAEDRDVLQNGVSCLTLIVRKDSSQLLGWSDGSGRSGLDHVLVVIAKLLQNEDESGGLVIGDLIIHLLRNVGDAILPVLPELLHAMLRRMTAAKTATFLQSLVIPFAFLIYKQRDTLLSLLESTTIDGRSGLDIFIQTWCENAETFQGFWPSRLSTVALTQLYAAERPSLQNLTVKGDIIIKPETKNVIMTRSKTKSSPQEFTRVPFPVKALKILLHDVQSGGESATITAGNDTVDIDSDDGNDEWADEEKLNQGFKDDEFAFLSDMLGPRGMAFDNDDILDDNDDEDLKNDEISTMDLQNHLLTFFKACAAQNTSNFAATVQQMSVEEIAVIQRLVQQQ
ncbi:hypothetical protein HGRIS_008615 [Hohenbuehelia grisea]|uniref:Importin N-terminal domain-containing protein n=1 Tax=Hohenbuehelia grisea TaxID=104357 RepID=A0ABR3J8K0_9AGAR